jgi:nitroimidazol reductase NimA-like FMN-containing flavoprotein (pyridoxamine 5'-phosphate oxidase superfamily)
MAENANGQDRTGAQSRPFSDASRVRRVPDRARYDRATVHAILDASPVAHVGIVDDRPIVVPMIFGRDGDRLYLHGSVASRLQRVAADGIDLCVTTTLVDGIVLARSAFHHSVNYRSVVVLGTATRVPDARKPHALEVISEHLLPGRWAQVRLPNDRELRQTSVLEMSLEESSAKIRTGGAADEPEDMALPIWAGVIPCALTWGAPCADADSLPDAPYPPTAPLSHA